MKTSVVFRLIVTVSLALSCHLLEAQELRGLKAQYFGDVNVTRVETPYLIVNTVGGGGPRSVWLWLFYVCEGHDQSCIPRNVSLTVMAATSATHLKLTSPAQRSLTLTTNGYDEILIHNLRYRMVPGQHGDKPGIALEVLTTEITVQDFMKIASAYVVKGSISSSPLMFEFTDENLALLKSMGRLMR